jgi:hypothetical protein
MDSILMDSISRFRAELDQIEYEIRRFERLYDLHRLHNTTTTHDRNRGRTAEHSTGPKQAHPPSDDAFELRGLLFVRISSEHFEINRAATI